MKAAATTVFRSCRRFLTTDLSWPSYQQALATEADRQGRHIFTVPVRHDILSGRLPAEELAETLAAAFVRRKCDSLFLPAVDNFGIRVPIPQIVRRIECSSPIRFVLTDAAQALAHIPLAEVCRCSDFVIAGCHKWVHGYYPLGIGIGGERRRIPACRAPGVRATELKGAVVASDPLAGFLENLETGRFAQHLETVNLGPLFSAQGALSDMRELSFTEIERSHLRAASKLREIARQAGCHPVGVDRAFQSRIQLVNCVLEGADRMFSVSSIERGLMKASILATTFESGLIRFSLPFRSLSVPEVSQLSQGLAALHEAFARI